MGALSGRLAVAQCCFTPSWGGLERWAAALARSLAGRDDLRSLAICRPRTPLATALAAIPVPILEVEARDYWAPGAAARIRRFVAGESIAILHAHRGTDLWLLAAASLGRAGRGPRLVWTSHILFRRTRKRGPLHRWLYGRVDRAIAPSATGRQALLDCLPLRPEQVRVIPHGIDTARFPTGATRAAARARARALLKADGGTPVIGLLGRLEPRKGQREAIAALPAVKARFPAATLVLAGGPTDGRPEEEAHLRRLVAGAGLGEAVRFLGAREDVPALLAAFDLLLVPSHGEAFGLVVLEGMAAGVPVIAAAAGGPPEILDGGRAGALVEPRDPAALAAAIVALLADPERRQALAARARARVETHYALERIVERTVDLYAEVAGGTPIAAGHRPR